MNGHRPEHQTGQNCTDGPDSQQVCLWSFRLDNRNRGSVVVSTTSPRLLYQCNSNWTDLNVPLSPGHPLWRWYDRKRACYPFAGLENATKLKVWEQSDL